MSGELLTVGDSQGQRFYGPISAKLGTICAQTFVFMCHGRLYATWISVFLYSESILDPEVPQALRLQAILTSGIVLLHKKKVNYLKEDAEHTMVGVYMDLFKVSLS